MSQSVKKENVNNNFFNGGYKEIWRQVFPEKTTQLEAEFIIEEGKLVNNSEVLDIMCGYGRHAFELAKKGIKVTTLDNLQYYIDEINEKAIKESLVINSVCDDVLNFRIKKEYDTILCMGNSLQFFDEEDTLLLLSNMASMLKSGGKFFFNTWSIAEIVMKNFKEKNCNKINDLVFYAESKFLLRPTRIETNSIIISENGEKEEKSGVDYIYSIAEIEVMLNKTGFELKEIYSIPGKKQFTFGEPRAYFVAEKK